MSSIKIPKLIFPCPLPPIPSLMDNATTTSPLTSTNSNSSSSIASEAVQLVENETMATVCSDEATQAIEQPSVDNHDVCDKNGNAPERKVKFGYSRTWGVMGVGQRASHKINLREQAIDAFDDSDLYYLRDPTSLFQGYMLSTRGSWSLLMDEQSKIQPIRNRRCTPGGPIALHIENMELTRVLWHITDQMINNSKIKSNFPSAF